MGKDSKEKIDLLNFSKKFVFLDYILALCFYHVKNQLKTVIFWFFIAFKMKFSDDSTENIWMFVLVDNFPVKIGSYFFPILLR